MTQGEGKITYSEYHNIEYGAPQGSCLGLLLFLIFTNDIHHCVENDSCLLFADDTTLYHSHRNIRYLKWCIEDDLHRMMDWLKANKLTLNVSKTECILFNSTKEKQAEQFKIMIGETEIKSSEYAKLLGIWLDKDLTWRKHTNTLLLKLKQNTTLLRTSNKFLNKQAKKIIYHAHIQSHLSYGILLWGNMIDQITKQKLQKCIDTCFKLITQKSPSSVNLNKEQILAFNQIIELENLKVGYKLYNNTLPPKITEHLTTDSSAQGLEKTYNYNTRHKHNLNLPVATNRLYHSSFLCKVVKNYAGLPTTVTSQTNFKTFTRKCKSLLLE